MKMHLWSQTPVSQIWGTLDQAQGRQQERELEPRPCKAGPAHAQEGWPCADHG